MNNRNTFKANIKENLAILKQEINMPVDIVWNNLLKVCIDTVNEQTNVMEWISCSERLPNCNGCYLVWRPHFFGGEIGMPAICYFDGQDTWHDSYGVDFTKILHKEDVSAWMPLPEPYKGD